MKKLSLCMFLCILCMQHLAAKFYFVSSDTEFKAIQPLLIPGDEVVVKNGTYSNWALDIQAKGTPEKPILIRAEQAGKVMFSGNVFQTIFMVSGNYVVLKDFYFDSCTLLKQDQHVGVLIELQNSNHCEVKSCVFSANRVKVQFMPLVIVSGTGNANTISDCSFLSNVDNQDVQVKITKTTVPKFTRVEHNQFRDKAKVSWANGNGGECVQVGQDPVLLGNLRAETTVTENKFTHCDAENEVISNKSSANSYLNNYFENNDGELVMRGGHDCIISGNVFKGGTGGIRINGTGHQILDNKISGIKTAIRLMYGMAKGKTETGFYIAASDCLIRNNSISNADIGILIGDSKDADWTGKFDTTKYPSPVLQNVAPFHNQLEKNTFSAVKEEVVNR